MYAANVRAIVLSLCLGASFGFVAGESSAEEELGSQTYKSFEEQVKFSLGKVDTKGDDKKPPSESAAHGSGIKQDKNKEENKDQGVEFGKDLIKKEDWSGENGDTFYGDGEYLTTRVGNNEMLFHSADGGKTYYPVKQGSYQIDNGVRLANDFNPNTTGAVEGRVASGSGQIANTVPQALDPAVQSPSTTRPSKPNQVSPSGYWQTRQTACSRAGRCKPERVWVSY